jgi:hypothetical protein
MKGPRRKTRLTVAEVPETGVAPATGPPANDLRIGPVVTNATFSRAPAGELTSEHAERSEMAQVASGVALEIGEDPADLEYG